jgi:outer membrane lipoprotein SlyB
MKTPKQVLAGIILLSIFIAGCSGGDLTTREKGAGIGALGGAAVGGIIGAAVGHPGTGAAISNASRSTGTALYSMNLKVET